MTAKGGPKTDKGKEMSAQNSLKHGLTAKGLISAKEEAELHTLTKELVDEYTPTGPIEKLLVKDLAMIRIQLERYAGVEASLFLNSQQHALTAQALVDSLQIKNEVLIEELVEAINSGNEFVDSQNIHTKQWLSTVKTLIDPEAPLSEECKDQIKLELRKECIDTELLPLQLIKEKVSNTQNPVDPIRIIRLISLDPEDLEDQKLERDEQLKLLEDYQLLDYVRAKRIETYQDEKKQKLLQAALDQKEFLISAALPVQGELDRLYRYRTTLEKQFSNKLSQLIQLQEMRERKERQKSSS